MISQVIYEIKKICKNKWMWLLFIGVIGLSVFTASPSSDRYMGVNQAGEVLEGKDAYWETQNIAKEYEGVMDETWFTKLDHDLQVEQRDDILRQANHEKMEEVYGEHWLELYLEDPFSFVNEKYKKDMPEGNHILYVSPTYTMSSLRYHFIMNLHTNYADYVRNQLWNTVATEDLTEMNKSNKKIAYASMGISSEDSEFIQKTLNDVDTFYFGSSDGWEILLDIMANAYFFLPMFIILLLSNIFNKERSYQMLELIRTSSYGKRKVSISKVIASMLISLFTVILFIGIVTLYVKINYGLGSPEALVTLTTNAISPFTFQEAYLNGTILFLIGCLVVGMTSTLLSCFCKTSYLSLALSALISVLPNIIPLNIMSVFPLKFMELTSTVVNPGLIKLFDSLYYTKDVVWIWLIPIFLACGFIYVYYKSYTFMEE